PTLSVPRTSWNSTACSVAARRMLAWMGLEGLRINWPFCPASPITTLVLRRCCQRSVRPSSTRNRRQKPQYINHRIGIFSPLLFEPAVKQSKNTRREDHEILEYL